jgi:heme exporter protein C
LWNSLDAGKLRTKACSVLGIMIAANVPIIYKSVSWWRTLHQPPSLMRKGGASMSPEILQLLVSSIVIMLAIGIWMMVQRYINIRLQESLDEASYRQLKNQEEA